MQIKTSLKIKKSHGRRLFQWSGGDANQLTRIPKKRHD